MSEVDRELTRARAQVMYASVLTQLGKVDEAFQLSKAGYETYFSRFGLSQSQALMAGHNHALILAALGKNEDASKLLQRVMTGRVRVLGREHPDTLMTTSLLADAMVSIDETEQAQSLYTAVLAVGKEEDRLASVHAMASKGLLKLQFKQKQYALAERTALQHIGYSQVLHGAQDYRTHLAKTRLAMVYFESQQFQKAASLCTDLYQALGDSLGDENRYRSVAARIAARAYEALGDTERAQLWRRRMGP